MDQNSLVCLNHGFVASFERNNNGKFFPLIIEKLAKTNVFSWYLRFVTKCIFDFNECSNMIDSKFDQTIDIQKNLEWPLNHFIFLSFNKMNYKKI